jgi:hypothetical protein
MKTTGSTEHLREWPGTGLGGGSGVIALITWLLLGRKNPGSRRYEEQQLRLRCCVFSQGQDQGPFVTSCPHEL